MQESSSSLDIEQASWLNLPEPGFRESWRKRNEYPDLMDGAYFGLNGDSILDMQERVAHGPAGHIVMHNPGVRKMSAFIPDLFAGKILAALDSDGTPKVAITFAEAENEGWIQERFYSHAWSYLGKDTMTMGSRIGVAQNLITNTVYQVTKKGVGKVAITDRDVQRPNILYFFGLRPRI